MKDRAEDTARRERPPGRAPRASRPSPRPRPPPASGSRSSSRSPSTLPPTHLPAGKTVLQVDAVTVGLRAGPAGHPRPVVRRSPGRSGSPSPGRTAPARRRCWRWSPARLSPWAGTVQVDDRLRRARPAGEPARPVGCRSATTSAGSTRRPTSTPAGPRSPSSCSGPTRRCRSSSTLSGGQLLRAGLACVLGGPTPPPLLILDEPTNHLDIDSIEAVEAGLRAYDGALLVVSHDETFLEAIGITRRLELSPRDSMR